MYKIRAVRIIHFMTEEGEREMKERTAAVHLSPVWAYWLCFHITTSVNRERLLGRLPSRQIRLARQQCVYLRNIS